MDIIKTAQSIWEFLLMENHRHGIQKRIVGELARELLNAERRGMERAAEIAENYVDYNGHNVAHWVAKTIKVESEKLK